MGQQVNRNSKVKSLSESDYTYLDEYYSIQIILINLLIVKSSTLSFICALWPI